MKNNDTTFLQKLMEEMNSDQLNEMLQDELQKEAPDGDAVRAALRVLESREKLQSTKFGDDAVEAWKRYQEKTNVVRTTPTNRHNAILKAASVVLIFSVLFFAIPQSVQASGLFERIVQWTDGFLELLMSKNHPISYSEYVFKTDNPGLQQVYDTVVELGVTEPVIPMWLPGDYLLVDYKVCSNADWACLFADFNDGFKSVVIQIAIFTKNVPSSYYKDEATIDTREVNGIQYNIIQNNNLWVAVWTHDNIECFIAIDCQEDELYRMIESIYLLGDE